MDIKKLHEAYRDRHSPSVEGQIRWLQKQGFAKGQIERAMYMVYSDIERGEIPQVYRRVVEKPGGGAETLRVYRLRSNTDGLDSEYKPRDIHGGSDLDHVLLEVAKTLRTEELTVYIGHIEQWEEKMREKWEASQKKSWWRRVFGS